MQRLREQWALLMRRWQTLREQATELWSKLSERDQQIVSVVGIAGTIFLIGVIAALCSAHLSKLHRDIASRSKALGEIHDLRGEYMGEKQKLDALNIRLRQNGGEPKTFLEDKARELNIMGSIDMTDRAAPPNDLFKAQMIEVSLKKITVANVSRYLYKIESGSAGMTVKSIELYPNFQDNKYLDGKLMVQALRPKE